MNVVVIGGGILGLSTGYYLAKTGHSVVVLESGTQLGGLATDVCVDGVHVDRFYHCILNSDDHLIGLIEDVGLADQLRMCPVRSGFYADGKIYPISTPVDLLRFPPIGFIDRLRLIRSILACRRIKDWHDLENVDVGTWLRRLSGDRVFEQVWRPLLSAKFDGNFDETPATYIWSRTVRMSNSRSSGNQRELAGHLVGGYRTLCDRLAERIEQLGGTVLVNHPVNCIHTVGGRVSAVSGIGESFECDAAVLTVPLPIASTLLESRTSRGIESPDQTHAIEAYVRQVRETKGYLGVICLLLMLDRRLSDNYTLYLGDEKLPFTAVIESTNIIDPDLVDDRHLIYLPKYVDPESEAFQMPDDLVRIWFLSGLRQIYPDLNDDDIIASAVFRAPYVEPLHPLGSYGTLPSITTPIDGIWLGSTKHLYPRLNSGDSVTRLAATLAGEVDAWQLPERTAATAEIAV